MLLADKRDGNMSYELFLEFVSKTYALEEAKGLLQWDQETMMPMEAGKQRAKQLRALEEVIHHRWTSSALQDTLGAIDVSVLDSLEKNNVRLAQKEVAKRTSIPEILAGELTETTANCLFAWGRCRKNAQHLPEYLVALGNVVALSREKASCLSGFATGYDALLDAHEPEMTGQILSALFADLEPKLQAIRSQVPIAHSMPASPVAITDKEMWTLAKKASGVFGYDVEKGRMDLSHHPFCTGKQLDVRITTRLTPESPLEVMYSTIHETGHAVYEQNIHPAFAFTPNGQHCSMGIHESQSRLFENQLAKSDAFMLWLCKALSECEGVSSRLDVMDVKRYVNAPFAGRIRTESDQLHYNLHIILRFELEMALIDGRLQVEDLKSAWDSRFEALFGYAPRNLEESFLQDPHWALGEFGYFPTYALGNVYAACFFEAIEKEVPEYSRALEEGNTHEVRAWLKTHVHQHGQSRSASDLLSGACENPVSIDPLVDYLRRMFVPN